MRFSEWIRTSPVNPWVDISPDQMELVFAFDEAFNGYALHQCHMGRSRGTTTLLVAALRWLERFQLSRYTVVICDKLELAESAVCEFDREREPVSKRPQDAMHVQALSRLSSMRGMIHRQSRPDFAMVDLTRPTSAFTRQEALARVDLLARIDALGGAQRPIRGVIVNA